MTKATSHYFFMGLLAVSLFVAPLEGSPKDHATKKEPITVMAASSLSNVLPEVAAAWKAHGGLDVVFNFEATSRLAQQITAGAPADLFFSADMDWMDHLQKKGKIEDSTRSTLLSNQIVLVVPSDSAFVPASPAALPDARLKHLALAGESVPAGKFARAALKSEGVLEEVQEKIVNAENVRAALQWVAKKEAEAGIVFRTDARIEPRVKVAFSFPESTHPKIEYPVASIRGSKHLADSKRFLEFCKGHVAKKIFESAGFIVLGTLGKQ